MNKPLKTLANRFRCTLVICMSAFGWGKHIRGGQKDKAIALYREILEASQNRELRQEAKKHLEELNVT
jgi:hypothetical protein